MTSPALLCAVVLVACGARPPRLDAVYHPAAGPLFTFVVIEKDGSTTGAPVFGKESLGWQSGRSYVSVVKTWVIQTDPSSRVQTQLGWVKHFGYGGLAPFFWDAHRRVLWVSANPSGRLVGLVDGGVVLPTDQDNKPVFVRGRPSVAESAASFDVRRGALPPPFGYADTGGIWNVETNESVKLDATPDPKWFRDGSVLTAVALPKLDGSEVTITTINWASPPSARVKRSVWSLPPLEPGTTRQAIGLTEHGRNVVEILAEGERIALRTHDIDGTSTRTVALDGMTNHSRKPYDFHIIPIYGDALIVGYNSAGFGCLVGHSVRVATGDHAMLPTDCVSSVGQYGGLVSIKGGHGLIDAKGVLRSLGQLGHVSSVETGGIVFATTTDRTFISPDYYPYGDARLSWFRIELDTGAQRPISGPEARTARLNQSVARFSKAQRDDLEAVFPNYTPPAARLVGPVSGLELNILGGIMVNGRLTPR